MLTIDPDHVSWLRDMASRGVAPSQMLRDLLDRTNPEEPRSAVLAWYLMHAFGLEQHQVAAVFGWDSKGTGPLSDAQLDELLARHLPAKADPVD
ncbi:MAG TPA: hypothetical protein VJ739_09915 [Gemmataceae bacterium]|nr:hypothetical protein [Gemmataceae bacterium]